MFTPTVLEKGPNVGLENSSASRGNISSRFPVGISHLGDENQQIRIQLAVHKYNSSANSSAHARRSFVAPVRHSFLKNSLKGKKSEDNGEQSLKIDKKCGNRYEGVGTFPTVHLKKNAIRYRPIRRFNEFKVPYPELPVNRFLSHLPELCPDLKSSTRSVLDVLQDLSRKKIHSKEEDELIKSRTRGLGGDLVLSANTSHKPLFVQKPIINEVLTRDSTTQTLLSHNLNTVRSPSSNSSISLITQENSDPRAELRRKLAKQNNEIFASLSSSTTVSFSVKRKLDKILLSTDKEDSNEVLAVKKVKVYECHTNNQEENGNLKFKGSSRNDHLIKLNWKSKLNETSSTSSNKDRLTSIFLDLQSTSPKTQIFQDSVEQGKDFFENRDARPADSIKTRSVVNGSEISSNKTEDSQRKSTFVAPVTLATELEKKENKVETNGVSQSFLVSSTPVTAETVAQLKSPNSLSFTFGSYSTTNGKVSIRGSTPANTNFSCASKSADDESKNDESQSSNKAFALESFNDGIKGQTVGAVKFGIEGVKPTQNQCSALPSILNEPQNTGNSSPNSITSNMISQFTFDAKSMQVKASPKSQPSGILHFEQNISTSNSLSPGMKSTYTVAQSPLFSSLPGSITKSEDKLAAPKTGSPLPSTTRSLSSGIPTTFVLGENSESIGISKVDTKTVPDTKLNIGQNSETPPSLNQNSSVQGLITQIPSSRIPSFLQSSTLETSSTTAIGHSVSNPSLIFAQKPAVSEVSNAPSSLPVISSEEQKSQPAFSFNFGQKFESKEANKAPETNVFVQKTSPSLFTFGPKVSTRESPPSSAESTATFGQTTASTQAGQKPPTHSLLFEQNASQSSTARQVTGQPTTFGQFSSIEQTSDVLGAKTQTASFAKTPAFGQSGIDFRAKTNIFSSPEINQTTSGFGTSSSNGFGAPASTQSGFSSSSSAQPSAFGTPASTQSGFGVPVVTQSATAFGTPSTTQAINGFGGAANTQSSALFAFGSSAHSTQSSAGFGAPAASQSGFDLSSQISFGQAFGHGGTKPTTSLEQPTNTFGQNSQSNTAFTSPSTTTFGSSAQNSIFGRKTESQTGVFGQNTKIQNPSFGANLTSQSFSTPSQFQFGMSKSSLTGFTTSPPNTTAPSVFNFGASTPPQSTAYSFGSSSSTSTNAPTSFAFKFGASTTKEGCGFSGSNTSTFTFGAQINNNARSETKPGGSGFNFGAGQPASSAPAYNFGSTPSPSLFSFGGSGSSANSGSSFNFGTPQPGGPFGQSSTPSPAPFSVPGTFSIGSGSSQSPRPRASSRLRRRP